jgi:hypothetical protein
MSMSIFDKRPPFVRFEEREMGLNAVATEKEGRPIPHVVILACITPHGSKDVHEKIAEDYLAQIKSQAMSGQCPIEWHERLKLQFEEWRKGNELPRDGTPVKTWAMATNEQRKRLIGNGITIVEDLAAFPDSNLQVIGMDGRYLRDMARGWITEAKDKGANAKALADANVEISMLKETNDRLGERVSRLEARLEAKAREHEDETPRRGPGRPRKDAEAAA